MVTRLVSAPLVALALLASACSTTQPSASDGASSAPASVDQPSPSNSAPEGLAFSDELSDTLRVSVPTMDFVAPHEVDETDPVQVLVTDLLTDGLTIRDPGSGIPLPGVASSFRASTDGLTWTFFLGDSTFGDGSPILAADVVASLNRVADQGVTSISGSNLWPIVGWEAASDGPVEGIVALDDVTVQISLTEQFSSLAEVLAGVTFGIWPAEPNEATELPTSSAIDFTPTALWENGIRLEGEERPGEVSAIELLVDPAHDLVETGDTDLGISADPDAPLGDLRGVTVERSADAFYAMNSLVAPFDDALIRQAIVHAVDREALRQEFFPNAGLMESFVPMSVLGGTANACGDACAFDVEQATLLVEASPSRGIEFSVDFFADEDDDTEQRLAEAVVSSLRAVGLLATARPHLPEDYGARAANGELGMFRFGSVSTTLAAEAEIAALFHSAGRDNLTGTSISRFDGLIQGARAEANPVVRASIYEGAEQLLFAEAVVLPLVEFRHSLVLGPSLASAGLEPDGSLDLSVIEFAASE